MYERHGHAKNGLTRIYGIWQGMRYRCYGESCTSKQHYSGKGVAMCDAWRESFTPFLEWSMANGYTDKLTIDRIDSNGNYEPSNCRWVTMQVQAENRSNNCMVEVDGKRQTIGAWARETGMHITTLYQRYRRGARGYDVIKPSTEMLRASILPHQVRGNKKKKQAVAMAKPSHVSHMNI